ncbi:preprotein translocase subunit SecE [Symmachiella dynata]|nr:preprotein translocase subunit SecE [Symmachiella dynata]
MAGAAVVRMRFFGAVFYGCVAFLEKRVAGRSHVIQIALGREFMANAKKSTSFLSELLSLQSYKPKQGRLVRQLTTAGVALIALLGAVSLSQGPMIGVEPEWVRVGVPVLLFLIGLAFAFRVVNYSVFADFLIAVQGELTKVSWPSKQELKNSTIVVVVTMFALGGMLLVYDLFWYKLMTTVGVLVEASS